MHKITATKQQVKRSDRYSIFVDGKYSFSLSERELINSGVHSGQELTAMNLKEYKRLSQNDKIYGLVLSFISRRPRSNRELRDYLYRKGSNEDETILLLNRLSNSGIVDDEAFAKAWVESRKLLKPTSLRMLKLELQKKGISSEIIEKVLSTNDDNDTKILNELIVRKRRQTKYQDNTKLMQYLARKGFNYGDIKEALLPKD